MQLIKSFLASLVLLAFLIQQALATVLWVGGEDLDIINFSGVTVTTTSSQYRTSFARAALSTPGGGSSFGSQVFANQSVIWIHGVSITNNTLALGNEQGMRVYGSDGVIRLVVRAVSSTVMKISTRNTAGTLTDLVTCIAGWPKGTLNKVDWYVNYAVAGQTTLYSNGVQLCTYSGDITTNSVTAVNQVAFLSPTDNGTATSWSEMIVATTDTRDMNLFTCQPVANGTTQNFTGTASSVNPTTINDANSIFTASNNVIGAFTCPSLVAGTYTVPAVVQSVRTQIGTTGPQNFRYIARPAGSGADFDNGSDIAGSASFGNTQNVWATDPNTSAAWATSALGAGVNFGIKSRP